MDPFENLDPGELAMIGFGLFITFILLFVVYSFIGVFVLGVFLYYATRPFFRRFEPHVPRSGAAVASLLALAVPLLLLVAYTAIIGYQEFGEFLQTADMETIQQAVSEDGNVTSAVQNPEVLMEDADAQTLKEAAYSVISYAGFVLSSVFDLLIAFALAFYLLRDGPRLRTLLERYLYRHSDVLENTDTVYVYFEAIDDDLETVFFGNILTALIIAVISALTFNGLNLFAPAGLALPYPSLLGVLTGAGSLIPVVGMKIVYGPLIGYMGVLAAFEGTGWWFVGALLVASVVVIDTIPELALRPYVSGRDLHVGSVMFAYIFGPLLFGWYGLFLGPLLLVLAIHFYSIVLGLDEEIPASLRRGVVEGDSRSEVVLQPNNPETARPRPNNAGDENGDIAGAGDEDPDTAGEGAGDEDPDTAGEGAGDEDPDVDAAGQ